MRLGEMTTFQLAELLKEGPVVALLPIGSTEPHGPHLPLGTDVIISEAACEKACEALRAVIAPSISYGVTDFAEGFAGAVSISADVLGGYVSAVATALLGQGFSKVCVVNNHLEPAHDAALKNAIDGIDNVVFASPLIRQWAKTLSDEFKSGACHAGKYETSIVMAARPELVNDDIRETLDDLSMSLSEGIRDGATKFSQLGMDKAYTGAPREASATHGAEQIEQLANMICSLCR